VTGGKYGLVMLRRCRIALLVIVVALPTPLVAARQSTPEITPDRINNADFAGKSLSSDRATALAVKLQILLDRAHFSPGEIDGKLGENAKKALRAYADANGVAGTTELTQDVWQKLAADDKPPLTQYTISDADAHGPFLDKLPTKLEQMKDLRALSYLSPREELAEKFHVSEDLLSALNPGQKFDQPGATITVPNVVTDAPKVAAARVEIDKTRQTVKAFDKDNNLLAFYPATVGSEEKPSPSGKFKVTGVADNPTYHYNPKYHFKGVHSTEPFTIKPGPNNPVGPRWIGLNGEGYGIHGTASPDKVSKAASHGCVRLTNWDVEQLATMVKKGTPVEFVDGTS